MTFAQFLFEAFIATEDTPMGPPASPHFATFCREARKYGADTAVPDWREPLVCLRCGGRTVDMVVTGTERR